tara:strand:+ start:167 stop:553 length:387 start_codon:yes stop_codon:yes gene_type:complete
MDNYEVNVLTRKGGWKKLPQEVVKSEKRDNIIEDESIDVGEFEKQELPLSGEQSEDDKLFEKFSDISVIINKLKSIESEKSNLLDQLSRLEETFKSRKKKLDIKIDDIKKEYVIYQKAIDLIKSLKKV